MEGNTIHDIILTSIGLFFILTALLISFKQLSGIPESAQRIFQASIVFYILWAICNVIIFSSKNILVSLWFARVGVSLFNIATLLMFVFHELENKPKWYTNKRLLGYIFAVGFVSGVMYFKPLLDVKQVSHASHTILLDISPVGYLLEFGLITVLILHMVRRIVKTIQSSKYYSKKTSTRKIQLPLIIVVSILGSILITMYLLIVSPSSLLILIVIESLLILIYTFVFSYLPMSAIFQHQKVFSLFAITEGGMPAFHYRFHQDPSTNIADLMVSGALYSSLTKLSKLYQVENRIKYINLGSRFITTKKIGTINYMLISEYSSPILQSQLNQFIRNIKRYTIIDEEGNLNLEMSSKIFEIIKQTFYTDQNLARIEDLFVYPSNMSDYPSNFDKIKD